MDRYKDRSITELEIRHAVLNDVESATAKRALFYFKGYSSKNKHIGNLRREIERNRLKTSKYSSSEDLGSKILSDFENLISLDFPESYNISDIKKESSSHKTFQLSRTIV